MSGLRPKQAELSINTDMSKTEETRSVIEGMVDGLNDHRIADIGEFFSHGFSWMGNTGCGTKKGLKNSKIIGKNHFRQHFLKKSALMKHDCIWVNGQQHLGAKRQCTQEHLWV